MTEDVETPESGFPARFKQFLKVFNLTEGKLATQLSTTPEEAKNNRVRFGRWSKGQASPSSEGIIAVAKKYGVSVNWLFLGEGEMLRSDSVTTSAPQNLQPMAPEEVQAFRRDVAKWEQRYFELLDRHNKLIDSVVEGKVSRELDFLSASSQTTVTDSSQLKRRQFTQGEFITPLFRDAVPMTMLRGIR